MSELKALVQTNLTLHGIERSAARLDEIAIETQRLLSGLASVSMSLDYYDEPLDYAALLRQEASHD